MAKIVFAVLLGLALASTTFNVGPLTSAQIEDINANSGWTASSEFLEGKTEEEISALTGTHIVPNPFPKKSFGALLDHVSTPDAFDSRTQWPGCVHSILNQQQCGSCWAFGASEALSDRYCVQKQVNVVLSPQWLVSCDSGNMGCNGGWLPVAWSYLQSHGIPTQTCTPYTSGGGNTGTCSTTCSNGSAPTFYKADNLGSLTSPSAIQAEVMKGGPVETAFTVYQDFFSYTGGIYKHTYGGVAGGHAVKIVGWGQQSGTNYWIVANSWGDNWGLSGFFWIEFGQCGIDGGAYAGDAA